MDRDDLRRSVRFGRRRRHGADAAALAPGLTAEGARGACDGGIIDFLICNYDGN